MGPGIRATSAAGRLTDPPGRLAGGGVDDLAGERFQQLAPPAGLSAQLVESGWYVEPGHCGASWPADCPASAAFSSRAGAGRAVTRSVSRLDAAGAAGAAGRRPGRSWWSSARCSAGCPGSTSEHPGRLDRRRPPSARSTAVPRTASTTRPRAAAPAGLPATGRPAAGHPRPRSAARISQGWISQGPTLRSRSCQAGSLAGRAQTSPPQRSPQIDWHQPRIAGQHGISRGCRTRICRAVPRPRHQRRSEFPWRMS